MNFLSDWQDIMIEDMTTEGFRFSSTTSKDKELLGIRYFTYLRKKGGQEPRPRQVHKSIEFICPLELSTGLNQLVDVLQKGEDILPYLSKNVDDISDSKIDGMFNDWGVLHLHLGDRLDPRNGRYVVRTGPLLFLYLMTDDAYLINIYKHGDWTDRSILQTVQNNWPELIKPFVMHGVLGLSPQITEKEHAMLRNAGMSVSIELKDKNGDIIVIIPPGFGMASSRDAVQDVRSYHKHVREIHNIEKSIREEPEILLMAFNGSVPDPIQLKLVRKNGKWSVVEQSTGAKFDLVR